MRQKIYLRYRFIKHYGLRMIVFFYLGKWLVPNYRFIWPDLEWWDNVQFNSYLNRFSELKVNVYNTSRRWNLYQLLRLVDNIPGDTAECGVYRGASSYLICKSNSISQNYDRCHYLFDSFEGLSKPATQDGFYWSEGDLSCSIDEVRINLSEFSNISFHKGWIPERFSEIENKTFSFVHIDVDLYKPTLDSLNFFYPRITAGGIILCDDYGFTTCPGATQAVDEFLASKPEKMIAFPDGGGFFIKGVQTAKLFY